MTADKAPGRQPAAVLYVLVAVVIGVMVISRIFWPPDAAPEPVSKTAETTSAEESPARTSAPLNEEWRCDPREDIPDKSAPKPLRVPGGGLEAHEKLGGHTLARHVGRTDADLKERLEREPNISAASSFFDHDTAEEAVAYALAARVNQIERWLKGDEDRFEVPDYTCTNPIGISRRRGATAAQTVRKVRVILQRRERAPLGYFVLTAYPQ